MPSLVQPRSSHRSASTATKSLTLPAGLYQVDVEFEFPDFDVEACYFLWHGQRTGPWDYSWLPQDEGKLLLPYVELFMAGQKIGASRVLIPREDQLREKRFRTLIGFELKTDGPITLELRLRDGTATWSEIKISKIADLLGHVELSNYRKKASKFWLPGGKIDNLRHRWSSAPWARTIDRMLDGYAYFKAPTTLTELKALKEPCRTVVKHTDYVVFPGQYIQCLALRHQVFGKPEDWTQLLAWIDGLIKLEVWGYDPDPDGRDHNNDLAAAYNMLGVATAINWYNTELGADRLKAARLKIAHHTREMVRWIIAARSSWPGTSAQNHSYYGFQTVLLGAMALLNSTDAGEENEAEIARWLGIALRRERQFIAELPRDGTFQEGMGYEPFGLQGLLPGLSILEEFSGEPWMPREWIEKHLNVCLDLMPPGIRPGLSIGDGDNSPPIMLPLPAWCLTHHCGEASASKIIRRLNHENIDLQDTEWPSMLFFLALWGDDRTDHPATFGDEAPPAHLAAAHEDSGHCILGLTAAAKAYFLAGPPNGHRLVRTERHPYSFGHHQPDAGNVLLNVDKTWILQDTGYTYRKSSRDHNVLTLDGRGQHNDDWVWTAEPPLGFNPPEVSHQNHGPYTDSMIELAAYYPPECGLLSWTRRVIGIFDIGLLILDDIVGHHPILPAIRWISSVQWEQTRWQGFAADRATTAAGRHVHLLSLAGPKARRHHDLKPVKPGPPRTEVYPTIEMATPAPVIHTRWITAIVLPEVNTTPTLGTGTVQWGPVFIPF